MSINPVTAITDDEAKLKDFYDELPYPNIPIPTPLSNSFASLFTTHYTLAHYFMSHRIASSEGKVMLNAGCGSGVETLYLAESNPGAKIVAVDISLESVKLTEQRLRYHGFVDVECRVLDLRDLATLGYQYDFITCNDVIYLLDDPLQGVQCMVDVLREDGILRTNFHHSYGRRQMLEAQEAFRILGQFDIPKSLAIPNVLDCAQKAVSGLMIRDIYDQRISADPASVVNNFLLVGDKGFSISDVNEIIHKSGLQLIRLVDKGTWDLKNLFITDIPDFAQEKISAMSEMEKLRLFELLSPVGHRLIDFWACKSSQPLAPGWSDQDWENGILHINSVAADNPDFRASALRGVQKKTTLYINWKGTLSGRIDFTADRVPLIHALLEKPRSVQELIDQDDRIQARSTSESSGELLPYLKELEDLGFLLLEPT